MAAGEPTGPERAHAAEAEPDATPSPARPTSGPWSRGQTLLLLGVGLLLSVGTFLWVVTGPDYGWHGARDLELRESYRTYQETGVLLAKETGTGSWYTQIPGAGEYSPATWDEDPGAYLVAALMSHVTGSESPYPGLRLAVAGLVALPLLILPLGVARVLGRPRAGLALIALPGVVYLLNRGTPLVGTEYGLSDAGSPTPVYALYGIGASLVFLSLTLLLTLSTVRMRTSVLVGVSVVLALLSGVSNLARSMSGMGTALGIGILWWLHSSGRARWWRAAAAAAVAVAIAALVPIGAMRSIDADRAELTGMPVNELPTAHALWHSMYLGLSYPTPVNGEPSPFGIPWSDEYGWQVARAVDPEVLIGSVEFDEIMRGEYEEIVRKHPTTAVRLYLEKGAFVVWHFAAMIAFAAVGIGIALWRRGPHRARLVAVLLIAAPTLAIGLAPPVLVMPLLYYFSELAAGLGLLTAVALGGLVWFVTTTAPAQRMADRLRPRRRDGADVEPAVPDHEGVPG
ncbi:hypothetical protein ACFO3K_09730 [Cellulomonas algicola]|uniref:hypothetical protein n=1 Tax=Cellulomonas algicola TaxID=2071633 RepID=UPI001C3FB10A|nr:hypothetical protein [Cellulomonas algicola]